MLETSIKLVYRSSCACSRSKSDGLNIPTGPRYLKKVEVFAMNDGIIF